MASTRSVNRKLGLLLACLVTTGFGCDDDQAADHDAEHGDQQHAAAGTGGEPDHDHARMAGPLTGATCPTSGSSLTYNNFAQKFFSDYCLSCHSEKLSGTARNGAPADHNFDKYPYVDLLVEHIDQMAGSGPSRTNLTMPPDAAAKKPTVEERQKLSEWIACGNREN